MNPRYFPLQKRRIRRLWHPSTIKDGMSVGATHSIPLTPWGEVSAPDLGRPFGYNPEDKIVPLGFAIEWAKRELPQGTTFRTLMSPSPSGENCLMITLPPQPLRISAKIRKLYEP